SDQRETRPYPLAKLGERPLCDLLQWVPVGRRPDRESSLHLNHTSELGHLREACQAGCNGPEFSSFAVLEPVDEPVHDRSVHEARVETRQQRCPTLDRQPPPAALQIFGDTTVAEEQKATNNRGGSFIFAAVGTMARLLGEIVDRRQWVIPHVRPENG